MTAPTNVVGSGSADQLPLPTTTSPTVESGDAAPSTFAPAPHPRILGLDLSLTGTGMSDGDTTWLVRSAGKKADDLATRAARLRRIRAEVITHCEVADLVVIEQPAFSQQTGHMHDRSGLWWLVVMALNHRGLRVVEVSPTTLKKYACGRGNAKKGEVVEAAVRRFPHVVIGGDDNRADALWLHAMGMDHLTGIAVVPESHRIALKSVRWPVVGAGR